MTMLKSLVSRSGRTWYLVTNVGFRLSPCVCIPLNAIEGLADEDIGRLVRHAMPQLEQLLIEEQEDYEQERNRPSPPRQRKLIPGWIYLIRHQGIYKIGRTKNLERRMQDFNHQYIQGVELIHSIRTSDTTRYEADLHQQYAEYQVKGEWFDLPNEVIQAICALRDEVIV